MEMKKGEEEEEEEDDGKIEMDGSKGKSIKEKSCEKRELQFTNQWELLNVSISREALRC